MSDPERNAFAVSPDASFSAHLHTEIAPTRFGRFLYGLGHVLFSSLFKLFWGLQVRGRENIPIAGGLILASNHLSWADPPLVGCSMARMIHFMAKQELFDVPLLGRIIKQVNAFPIKRVERDVGAFRTAQRILAAGGAIIVFPEGTRQRNGMFGRPKPGVGMLAVKTNCPVVPVYVHNSNRLGSLKKLWVCFGQPLRTDGEGDYQVFTNRVMEEIIRLKETHLGPAG